MPDKTITLNTDETAILLCALDDREEKCRAFAELDRDAGGKLLLHIAQNPFGLGMTIDEDEPEQPEEEQELEDMDDAQLQVIYMANDGARSWEAQRILADRNGADEDDDEEEE